MSIDELQKREEEVGVLLIDANFSPVVNARYEVKDARFGNITSLDSLEMYIQTTGVISPEDALKFSSNMLSSYFALFNEEALQIEGKFIANV